MCYEKGIGISKNIELAMNTLNLHYDKTNLYQLYNQESYIPNSHVKQALEYFRKTNKDKYLNLYRTIYFMELPNNLPYILVSVKDLILNYLI